jgi:prefoldin subunit 5
MKSRRQMEDELQVVSKDADRLREEVRTAQKALSRAENRED